MYTTQDRVESYLKRVLTSDEVNLLESAIKYMSSYIDGYTNRSWSDVDTEDEEEVEATLRYFDGNGRKELWVDDFTALESISLLDSNGNSISELVTDTDWLLYPSNNTLYESVRLRGYYFPYGSSTVAITAVWGSGDVPDDVVMVCTALVGNYLSGMGDEQGKFTKESIEGYSYELKNRTPLDSTTSMLMATLDRWKKITL